MKRLLFLFLIQISVSYAGDINTENPIIIRPTTPTEEHDITSESNKKINTEETDSLKCSTSTNGKNVYNQINSFDEDGQCELDTDLTQKNTNLI